MAAVGRHTALKQAVQAWDRGDRAGAWAVPERSKSYLAPVVTMAMTGPESGAGWLAAEAEAEFATVETGFRLLDPVASCRRCRACSALSWA